MVCPPGVHDPQNVCVVGAGLSGWRGTGIRHVTGHEAALFVCLFSLAAPVAGALSKACGAVLHRGLGWVNSSNWGFWRARCVSRVGAWQKICRLAV